jgi:hypothetical protein
VRLCVYFACLIFELSWLVIIYLWMMLCYVCEPIAYLCSSCDIMSSWLYLIMLLYLYFGMLIMKWSSCISCGCMDLGGAHHIYISSSSIEFIVFIGSFGLSSITKKGEIESASRPNELFW